MSRKELLARREWHQLLLLCDEADKTQEPKSKDSLKDETAPASARYRLVAHFALGNLKECKALVFAEPRLNKHFKIIEEYNKKSAAVFYAQDGDDWAISAIRRCCREKFLAEKQRKYTSLPIGDVPFECGWPIQDGFYLVPQEAALTSLRANPLEYVSILIDHAFAMKMKRKNK